jgi:hypothetical protein
MEPLFRAAVFLVNHHTQARIEKDLLGFELAYAMLLRTLARVAVIPIEADNAGKVDH